MEITGWNKISLVTKAIFSKYISLIETITNDTFYIHLKKRVYIYIYISDINRTSETTSIIVELVRNIQFYDYICMIQEN